MHSFQKRVSGAHTDIRRDVSAQTTDHGSANGCSSHAILPCDCEKEEPLQISTAPIAGLPRQTPSEGLAGLH